VHLAAEHDPLAVEFDLADVPVRAIVARRVADRQGEGVASKLSQPGFCARSWGDHADELSEST
jgi:hypothetical protein